MQSSCPMCGAEIFPGARFCRRCGAPVRRAGDDDSEVSPQAATVPRAGEGRSTDGLGAEEPGHAADTSRVSRADLERLLQAPQADDAAAADSDRRTVADAAESLAAATPAGPRTTHADHPGLEPAGESSAEVSEEPTAVVPRPSRPPDTRETESEWPPSDSGAPPHAPVPSGAVAAPARGRWVAVVALCGAGLLFVVAAAWLAARLLLRPAPTEVSTPAPAPPATDPNQLLEEKLAEAEALLAQGNMDGALEALREANRLVPANVKAHQRLGELLLAAGRRREAIEEFRAVTTQAPEDFAAWRQLGAAQFAEGLYAEAAESYRRVLLIAGPPPNPDDLLPLADALRLSGRTDEARGTYQLLATVLATLPDSDLAALARQRLAELAQPTPTPDGPPEERAGEAAAAGETASAAEPAPPPASAPAGPAPPVAPAPAAGPAAATPAERYQRGVELWPSNRAAAVGEFRAAAGAGNPDAHYYLGLSYVEGRNLQGLQRAEVVAALAHFQHAQRGQFAGQARRYAQQLEREFDRIRKQ